MSALQEVKVFFEIYIFIPPAVLPVLHLYCSACFMYMHTAEATHYSPLPPLLEKKKKRKKELNFKECHNSDLFSP